MNEEEVAAAARAMEQLARLSGGTQPTWAALAMVALQAAAAVTRRPAGDAPAPAGHGDAEHIMVRDVQRLEELAEVYGHKALATIGNAATLVGSSDVEVGHALQHVLRAARYGNKVLTLRSVGERPEGV